MNLIYKLLGLGQILSGFDRLDRKLTQYLDHASARIEQQTLLHTQRPDLVS